jgi:hypothetical protein
MFENEFLPLKLDQQRQNTDAVKCRTLFSALISMFVFDILKIPGGCITPLAPSQFPSCRPERNPNIHLIAGWLQPKTFWLQNINVRYYHTPHYKQLQLPNSETGSFHSNGYNKRCILYCRAM